MSLMSPALVGGFFTTSTMPYLGSPDQARPERTGIWSSHKCSERSALPAIQRCPAPSRGGLPAPGRSAPGEVHPHLVLGNLLAPGLTRCGCFRVCVIELNHRGRKTVSKAGGKQQLLMPGPVDPAASPHCRLWKHTVQAMENENRKRRSGLWDFQMLEPQSGKVSTGDPGQMICSSPQTRVCRGAGCSQGVIGGGQGKVEDFSGL